jgi:hypothetical protein
MVTKWEKTFGMSRQGVRWRFYRLFNEVYIEAYQVIFFVENNFGTELRQMAMDIAKERVELRKKAQKVDFFDASRRENGNNDPEAPQPTL